MTIAERIKYLRKKILNITQVELAEKLSMSRSNLANIEAERIGITDRNIRDICEFYGVNKTWLLTGEGEIFEPVNKKDELSRFVGRILRDEESTFVNKFVEMLAALDPEDWKVLEKAVEILKRVN